MTKRVGISVIVVALAAVLGLVIVGKRGNDKSAAKPTPNVAGSARGSSTRVAPAAPVKSAHAIVTVTGAQGPLNAATVRLAREDGDVVTLQTAADGTAHSDALAPGSWRVSASADGHEPAALPVRELRADETVRMEIKLAAGGRVLSGIVTDATSGPIAGARIDAARLGAMARPTDAVASTLTGPDGKYSLSVAEGQLLVAASEPSYSPQSRIVDVGPAGGTASFQLVPGGVVEGIVRDEKTREPVANADVFARRDSPAMLLGERSVVRATTGADGRFRLSGLRPGAYDVTAQAGHVMSRAPTTLGLGVAEQISDVELLVASAPAIRGVTVDEHGAPVPDIEVNAFGEGPGRGLDAKSDAKGAFVIDGVQPGRYMVVGKGGSYLPGPMVSVEVDTKDVNVKVTLRQGTKVVGHVEPRQAGCEIRVELTERDIEDMIFGTRATTGADGAFDLGSMKPTAYKLDARCANGDTGTADITVAPGMQEVVIAVKPGAEISGTVVDGSGKPVAAVSVMANPIGGTETTTIVNGMVTSGVQALTNAQGAYTIRGLAANTYRMGVLERGRPLPTKGAAPTVTLKGSEKKTAQLTVDRPDGVIKGVVTGPDGKPLADAWVSLHIGIEDLLERGRRDGEDHGGSRMVRVETNDDGGGAGDLAPVLTNAAGQFEFTGLARLPMTVVAEAQAGKLRGQATKVVADASITIQALGLSELRGTVKAAGPLAWFTVELEGPTREQRNFASAAGEFAFTRVDPGTYTVSVRSSAGNGEATVTVKPSEPARVDIVLAANAIVIGKLVDPAGKPVAGLPVAVVPDSGDGRLRVSLEGPPPTSSADGTFRLEVKAGKSSFIALTPPSPVSRRGLMLEPGKTLDLGSITVGGGQDDNDGPPKPP